MCFTWGCPQEKIMASVSDTDLATAIRVLQAAAPPRYPESDVTITLRAALLPHAQAVLRREKQRQKHAKRKTSAALAACNGTDASVSTSDSPAADDGRDEITIASDTRANATRSVSCERIGAGHLSRLLYANPVCILSTWSRHGSKSNVMTISWLAPLDNEGHFTLSMNATRHSARLLAANPALCLSVACAGLEPLLLRVGGCTGALHADKAAMLGVPLCRPGWISLDDSGTTGADESPDCSVRSDGVELDAGDVSWGGLGPLPAESSATFEVPCESAKEAEQRVRHAVAVTPCIAHVLARVESVRCVHGHLQLTCATVRSYARTEYWSGKTLEPQHIDLPPPLSFLGSQRFCTHARSIA